MAQNNGQLAARTPVPKTPTERLELPADGEIRLIVKFADAVKARIDGNGRLFSVTNQNIAAVSALSDQLGISFKRAISHPLQDLAQLQTRATALSGKMQPDLGGMMFVQGPAGVMLQAAQILNEMDIVEFVEFQPQWLPTPFFGGGGGVACGDPLATDCDMASPEPFCNDVLCCEEICAIDPDCCAVAWDATCVGLAAAFCGDNPVLACGVEEAGPCDIAHDPFHPYCDDADCCNAVCAILPDCCNIEWDQVCVRVANKICAPPSCADDDAQDCFIAHTNPEDPGCDDATCCQTVCDFDEYCCSTNWDILCAIEADLVCAGGIPNLCGDVGAGDCLAVNGSPYCDDLECCAVVCSMDPVCCDAGAGTWDAFCVELAEASCRDLVPSHPCDAEAINCFEPHPPGLENCEDPACCTLVCELDPFCCSILGVWDTICQGVALQNCRVGDVCANRLAGRCLRVHAGIGCSNEACCDAVCAADPTCCMNDWDAGCVAIAASTCNFDSQTPTPDFTELQGYLTIESYFVNGRPPIVHEDHSEGLPFPAPSYVGFTGEGFDLQGLWDFGEFLIDLGVDSENLTRGKTMRIGIIEHSAWVNHEDLDNKVIPEPGQTIIHFEGPLISSNHGTATLGITVAEDNGIGVTGIAPEAQGYFFPIVSLEEGGRLLNAIASALLVFEHGDVLSFSIGPAGCGTLASSSSAWVMLRMASDLGITSCISAGNDCCNLDEDDAAGAALGDSGAIVVGAGQPGAPYCRLGFSNHSDCGTGRVHCQAWGTAVATTGYGTLFNPGTELPDLGEPLRRYANDFGGTSAAAPMIAAITANLQGISKMFFGIPLMPEQIRGVVSGNGFFQCFVNPCDDLFGQDDDFNCLGDGVPGEDPNAIGLFPEVVTAAEILIATGWFDGSPLIDDIDVLRGTLISGNKFSIQASDNNRLAIKSQFTNTTDNIDLGIVYGAAGQITDLLISANSDVANVNSMTIVHEAHVTNGSPLTDCPPPLSGTGLVFFEMYDWGLNRWSFVAFDNMFVVDPPQLDCPIPAYPVDSPTRFVRGGDGRILLRIWTLSLGGNFAGFGGSSNQPYVVRHDWINIQVGGGGGGGVVVPP